MPGRVLAVGEVLWDIFAEEAPADGAPSPQKSTLGGAPLNFAAHLRRLGHEVLFVSALGKDELGSTARERIAALGLDTAMIAVSRDYETGTARVWVGPGGQTSFTIVRPAAYDDLNLAPAQLAQLSAWNPDYVYFGTLFASTGTGRDALHRVLAAVPRARRFYDVNLRKGFDSQTLVRELLEQSAIVKLNEDELSVVHAWTGLPRDAEAFARGGAERFGWSAVCITLGERGCALFANGAYATAPGRPVQVADPVGAGDAFAAAFVHGLDAGWPAAEIASFANRLGSLVASRPGGIPPWELRELTAS